jgi:hypothetical protein
MQAVAEVDGSNINSLGPVSRLLHCDFVESYGLVNGSGDCLYVMESCDYGQQGDAVSRPVSMRAARGLPGWE